MARVGSKVDTMSLFYIGYRSFMDEVDFALSHIESRLERLKIELKNFSWRNLGKSSRRISIEYSADNCASPDYLRKVCLKTVSR